MWKKCTKIILLVFLMLLNSCCGGICAVNTSTKPTDGNNIYIAGNPDLYPIEYYDSKEKVYKGMLPDLYAQISKTTSYNFTYINAGSENEQARLGKNNQVEIVSAHMEGDVKDLSDSVFLLSIENGGEKKNVIVGFTAIADKNVVSIVKSQLARVPDSKLLTLALKASEEKRENPVNWWLVGGVVVLFILCALSGGVIVKDKKKAAEKEKNKLTDPVTGIGNKNYFEQNYKHYISPKSCSLYYVACIAFDIEHIERYRGINDGEEIQKFAANILSQDINDNDFVSRMDEGVFLLALQSPSENEARMRIGELLNRINSYKDNALIEYGAIFRCGLFHLQSANIPFETTALNASRAYKVAQQKKLSIVNADEKLLHREDVEEKLARKLADAVKNNEFNLYLQFIVDQNKQIVGAEALSRWQNPEEGILTPANYIESLQEADIIDKLDLYIFEEACKQLEEWKDTDKSSLRLSCNFTRITVSRTDFIERFKEILDKYSFDHHRLIVELTEDSLADNKAVAYSNILECKKMGFSIALDDFGSGYSSFSDLCDYPINLIKIDRHIVKKSVTARGRALLGGIVKLAHDLNMKVLCEGVESSEENDEVIKSGCDLIQGYYYSRVLPKEDAGDFLKKYNVKE